MKEDKSYREMLNQFFQSIDIITEDYRKRQFEKELKQTLKENKIELKETKE